MALTLNFNALKDFHNSANNLLHSPLIQQALIRHRQEKWVHRISEESLTMLDICGISKDVLSLVKQHLLDLHFTLRRVIVGESDICAKISAYNRYRKKLKKETLKCLHSLRGMKSKSIILYSSSIDPNLVMVVDVLKEVRVTIVSIVESLLSLISIPWLAAKSGKLGFLTSKFLWSGSNHQRVYDVSDETAVQSANKRMEAVEIAIEDLEIELECMFRRLIQTRVLLLNILTPCN